MVLCILLEVLYSWQADIFLHSHRRFVVILTYSHLLPAAAAKVYFGLAAPGLDNICLCDGSHTRLNSPVLQVHSAAQAGETALCERGRGGSSCTAIHGTAPVTGLHSNPLDRTSTAVG